MHGLMRSRRPSSIVNPSNDSSPVRYIHDAEPVYQLFGRAGLGVADTPPPDHPVGDFIGYHVRTGDHDVTAYDWEQYLTFADRHFRHGAATGEERPGGDGRNSP